MINNIKNTQTIFAISIMIILMILTRGHSNWISTIVHLPDFTIPALFITGVYFRDWRIAIFLITIAIGIDNYAILYKGVSANCITPAYAFLPIAYYVIFLSGRFLTSLNINSLNNLLKVSSVIIIATSLEWILATTSYYAFTTASWSNFPSYVMRWAPVEISAILQWMIAITILFSLNYRFSFIPFFKIQKN
ncbi:Optional hypothetical component of the B12 transporter BtuM [hydrothermal vent metagenome]|uniref:Optional hypothetical component of the B12 transporter BtuM n=1 Tax=hydrothermal vent metagenome TaxID=652676 RepID=A0A1W1CAZ3_9ZZZZ